MPGRGRVGLVIDCVVLPASAHDNTAGIALLDGVAGQCDTVTKALVDQGFKKKVVEHGENVGGPGQAERPRFLRGPGHGDGPAPVG
ncbi:hypothetical protein GCM10023084_82510 [Streptomyces lacrimifluminis]|uniref:Transposase n=1 Tax=Streptomyces lacrimifluminis TaxID=1500077 RepID=A0A917UNJ4_9ACTN|nr:hypothetical protein GCM10012282_79170 [Streptomyces lacrimifluminis]